MKLEGILPFARSLLTRTVEKGDYVVDATIGNGHDTLFLANLVGENGHVFGFDIQSEAIAATERRLEEHGVTERTTLFKCGHENVKECIPFGYHERIKGAIFNLGYLPRGAKNIVTTPSTTILAVQNLLELLAPEGIIVLVIYHGHPEGMVERDSLLEFVKDLDQNKVHVLQYGFINQKNSPPFILALEKR